MARIVRALPGYGDIPTGFPVIVNERMSIIEPAFAYLLELVMIPGGKFGRKPKLSMQQRVERWHG
ncbi:hypothetical protein RFM99_10880 [Mesorhizobium sp. VK4C]|uniref:hypothetical protein n=1 Tax=Mesorhizobium captivum TaxID=3072319 RepID=UPI002A248D69|nr:hypothetical protein [Mesorhizobium sp. VK4C]MDX8498926.1 hypothetical protein [Mesorhizobium sp. VK4C]